MPGKGILVNRIKELHKKIELFQSIGYKSAKISLVIILFAILFGAICAYFFTRSICAPIKTLKDATDRIAQGDLDYRIDVRSSDEIGTLGTAFNQMFGKLKEGPIENRVRIFRILDKRVWMQYTF
ncbi:MAG: HAMP domain-containing protein [Candidatus Brocadia sp.]|nr:HAMP domain-containing protein [Candidatus Brocadia sp.]